MTQTTALVPLSFSPVDCVIRNFNADIRSRYPDHIHILHTDEVAHWASWGIFQGAEYFEMLELEEAKEWRKAAMYDYWPEEEEMEPDPMEGWFI